MFIFAPILSCTSSMHEQRQNNLQDWSSSDAIKQYIFCSISRDLRVDRRLPIGTGTIGEFLIEIPALNSIDCGNFERHTNPKAFWEWIMTLIRTQLGSSFQVLWKTQTSALPSAIRPFTFSQWRHIHSRPNPLRVFEYSMSSKYIAPKTTLGLRIVNSNFPWLLFRR